MMAPHNNNESSPNVNNAKVEKPPSRRYFRVEQIINQYHHIIIAYSRLEPMVVIMVTLVASVTMHNSLRMVSIKVR